MLLKYGILDDEGLVIRWVWVETESEVEIA